MKEGLTIGKLQEALRIVREADDGSDTIKVPIEKIPTMAAITMAMRGEYPDWSEVKRLEKGISKHGLEWLKKECANE